MNDKANYQAFFLIIEGQKICNIKQTNMIRLPSGTLEWWGSCVNILYVFASTIRHSTWTHLLAIRLSLMTVSAGSWDLPFSIVWVFTSTSYAANRNASLCHDCISFYKPILILEDGSFNQLSITCWSSISIRHRADETYKLKMVKR